MLQEPHEEELDYSKALQLHKAPHYFLSCKPILLEVLES
jgi:hypothetical protein